MNERPLIGVLDCNNFFVSCERLFRPDLVGKPVVVLSSNDGCVVARSQEVKDMHVPMGVPYFKVKDILEKGGVTTFSSHLALYRDISRRVFLVMRSEIDVVEQYSVDEAFFAVTKNPEAVALQLKGVVEKEVGIPVSIGIAATKTQAKYVNNLAKKGTGVQVTNTEDWQTMAADIPLSQIWGVGGQMELKYKQQGLATVADLLATDKAIVAKLFGVVGVRLQAELRGESVLKIGQKSAPQQSILSSRSFRKVTFDRAVLADAVAYHVRHAMADLRSMNMKTSAIRVQIRPNRYGDFLLRGGSLEAVLVAPSDDSIELLQTAHELLKKLHEPGVPYLKVGITLSKLVSADGQQIGLFAPAATKKTGDLMKVIDTLNDKEGKEVLLLGSRLQAKRWQSRTEACSPSYTTRWSEVAKVKA